MLSAGLSIGLTALLHEVLSASPELGYGIALVTVFIVNFLTLRQYIFRDGRGHVGKQLGMHALTSASFRGSEYLGFLVLHTWLGVYYLLAVLIVQTIAFVGKFVVYSRLVFPVRNAPVEEST